MRHIILKSGFVAVLSLFALMSKSGNNSCKSKCDIPVIKPALAILPVGPDDYKDGFLIKI